MIQTSKKLLIHGCMYLFQGIFVRDIICILFKYTFKWNICQHIDMDTFFHNIFTSIQEPTEEENISESISITDSEVLILPQPNYVSSIMSQITQARDVSGNCSNAFMECQDVEFPVTCINRICESEIFRYCRSSDVRMCESALQHHYDLLIFENCKANDIECVNRYIILCGDELSSTCYAGMYSSDCGRKIVVEARRQQGLYQKSENVYSSDRRNSKT
jgi:hypothetical protein